MRATRSVVSRLAPPGSRQRRVLRGGRVIATVLATDGIRAAIRRFRNGGGRLNSAAVKDAIPDDGQYRRWLAQHDPSAAEVEAMRGEDQGWTYRPLISLVVPVYNTDVRWLDAMVLSVRDQAYDNWELCLADDCSDEPGVQPALARWATVDARVKLAFREQNGNIAAASNTALAMATGEFIALLDHDDVLRPHALHAVVAALQEDREVDLVFSDEDKILIDGQRGQVHFKGEFDPDYLLSTNFVSHLSVLRRDLVEQVGGFRAGFDGSQDHELVLRVSERARRVRHVADVLYSWRQVPGSAALEHAEKPAAAAAGRMAVEDAVRRRAPGGRAEFGAQPGLYNARYPIRPGVRVTAVVGAVEARVTARSLAALRDAPGLLPRRWLVWGRDPGIGRLADSVVETVSVAESGNQAGIINELVAADDCDVILFLAGDVTPRRGRDGWLEPLVEQAIRDTVGAVGGRIIGGDGRPEQDGLRLDAEHGVASAGVRLPVIQRVSAVSIDCLAIDRSRFTAMGGFDDRYSEQLHDIDLCLRLRRAGWATVFTPLTELHRLSPPRGRARTGDDVAEFRRAWEGSPEWPDPYVSPWLDRVAPFVIRT